MPSKEDIILAADTLAEAAGATAQDLAREDVAGEEDFSGQLRYGQISQPLDCLPRLSDA
jgi:hypothetical protein